MLNHYNVETGIARGLTAAEISEYGTTVFAMLLKIDPIIGIAQFEPMMERFLSGNKIPTKHQIPLLLVYPTNLITSFALDCDQDNLAFTKEQVLIEIIKFLIAQYSSQVFQINHVVEQVEGRNTYLGFELKQLNV